eukprot:2096295-Rhodomonas_salina.4
MPSARATRCAVLTSRSEVWLWCYAMLGTEAGYGFGSRASTSGRWATTWASRTSITRLCCTPMSTGTRNRVQYSGSRVQD